MATFNATSKIPQGRQQNTRRVELHYTVDFTNISDGTGLAASETAKICTLPAGYVHERLDPILRTAEGEAAPLDVGTEPDPDCFLDGGNVNGTPNAKIALAGTEAATAGTYYHTATDVVVGPPAAAATLNVGKVDLTSVGYMVNTGTEQ